MNRLEAAHAGRDWERQRVLRMLDDMAWAASISPQPAGRVVEERLQTLRDAISPPALDPDPLRPDEDPRVPRHEPTPARSFLGCRWWVVLAVTIAIAVLLIAAPRGATNDATGREGSALHDGGPASSLLGAPQNVGASGSAKDVDPGPARKRWERSSPATESGAPNLPDPSPSGELAGLLPAVPSGASEQPMTLVCAVPNDASRAGRGTESGCVRAVVASMPAPTPTPEPTGGVGDGARGGYAVWHDNPRQPANARYAAAGPGIREWLGSDWRGQVVRVTYAGRSTLVPLSDWCACGDRAGLPTLIDLSTEAWLDLAPLSAGVIEVDIVLVGLPPTEVME